MSISFERLKQLNGKTVQIPFAKNFFGSFASGKNEKVLIDNTVLLTGNGATNFIYEIQNCNSRLAEKINSLCRTRVVRIDFLRDVVGINHDLPLS
ncbi:hypothetical protein [Neisseria weixii]|uniref:hypothetical protein n=1 Tax=Neisseria weixii TaxID=1853276 RepID=UPI0035A0E557